jgi:hypothetical protein
VTLGEPVLKGAQVKVVYDGAGGLRVAGQPVPDLNRAAVNGSTHRLRTTWGEQLDENDPLPEYPRPQLVRRDWLNLNGQWEFAGAAAGQQPVFGQPLAERITVPFPWSTGGPSRSRTSGRSARASGSS